MKLKVNNYIYKNPILDNFTILNLSDIHGNINNLNLVLSYLKNNKVDLIIIPGDIIDKLKDDNQEFINKLKELANYSKVYIALGNHDLAIKRDTYMTLNNISNNKYMKELINTDNIYLSTSSYEKIKHNKNIDIHLIILPNEYFTLHEKDLSKVNKLFKEIENNKVDTSKFNIMLVHSPNPLIINNKLINNKLINSMNLIVCGHNHGGLTPTFIQDIFKNHIGLFGPYYKIFNKNSYGIIKNNNTSLLISNGITKLSNSSFKYLKLIIKLGNKILMPEIDIINLKKNAKYKLELINRKKYKE